jgi:hypothetical protein
MEAIRIARPPRLYVAADGPRQTPGEAEHCATARKIATQIDWPCELKTLFREQNLGCRLSVSGALDWFFREEEEGIILEDDCVPSQSFFPYCAELLGKYRHDERIMCISGVNFQDGRRSPYSYYFSRYMHCWGWASWRRAWKLYDRDMHLWPEYRDSGLLRGWSGGDADFAEFWTRHLDRTAQGLIDTWDHQWLLTCWINNGLTCLPSSNLVTNVGFGGSATHTVDALSPFANVPAGALEFPLSHPRFVSRNVEADTYMHRRTLGQLPGPPQGLVRRGARFVRRIGNALRKRSG